MTRRPPPSQGGIGTSEEPRMRVSKEQAARNRKQILTAAARLFRENGIRATGVDSISQGAGLTHGAFYSQFESKEALAVEAPLAARGRAQARKRGVPEHRRGIPVAGASRLTRSRLCRGGARAEHRPSASKGSSSLHHGVEGRRGLPGS